MKKIIFGVSAMLMLAGATVFASNSINKQTEKKGTCCCNSGSCANCSNCNACTCSK